MTQTTPAWPLTPAIPPLEPVVSQSPRSVEELQDWLASQIAAHIGVDADQIDLQTSFHQFGLDSVQAMGIAAMGQQQLGVEVSPLVMWSCPNIDSLARYLAEEIAQSEREVFSL